MNWQTDDVLEESISSIAAGKARVESCLMSYPAMADELEPLLLAAEKLRAVPRADLAPEAKARIGERVLAAAIANPRLRPASRRRRALLILPGWRWAFSALAALFVFVFLVTTTLVTASADALPGSTLYPVKLAAEDVWLWATPTRARPALHLRLAHRRLDEVKTLAGQGLFDESVVQAMTAHVEAALEGVGDLPPALALPVLEQMADQIDAQQQTLVQLLAGSPVASRGYLEQALRTGERQSSLVEALQNRLNPYEPATSPELAGTATPGIAPALPEMQSITATLTPASTVTPTLTVTLTPTTTPTVLPTSQPAGGTEPEATLPPPPTATQPPPPTATQPPPPTATPPPPEPTDTPWVPPGLTDTPEPPGQTRTPKPTKTPKP
jgi:hypothetical protein